MGDLGSIPGVGRSLEDGMATHSSILAWRISTDRGACWAILLGRKFMTNLDNILKSSDITLSTKVRLVKAMVFPAGMYGCESWTVKRAEHQRIDAFELWFGEDF